LMAVSGRRFHLRPSMRQVFNLRKLKAYKMVGLSWKLRPVWGRREEYISQKR